MGHNIKPGVATGKEVQAIFNHAKANSYALPAVNVIGSDTINGVLETARDLNAPVIIQFSNGGAQFNAGKGLSNDGQKAAIAGAIAGAGAIAVIRVSGPEAIAICAPIFKSIHGEVLAAQKTHTIHLGHIIDGERVLDEVLVSLFKGSNSYTGEPTVEISCHGSSYIQQEILQLLSRKGCRTAQPGEFTLRSFVNGKIDLKPSSSKAFSKSSLDISLKL